MHMSDLQLSDLQMKLVASPAGIRHLHLYDSEREGAAAFLPSSSLSLVPSILPSTGDQVCKQIIPPRLGTSAQIPMVHSGASSRSPYKPIGSKPVLSFTPCPIHRLPNEILSYIFHYATCHDHHDSDSDYDGLSPQTYYAPMRISHVCHTWRCVALDTGRLWCSIVLVYYPSTADDCHRASTIQESCLAEWLKRSKSYPVDIIMDFRDQAWTWNDDDECHGFSSADMDRILRIVIPQANRWRKMHVLTDTWEPIYSFLKATSSVDVPPPVPPLLLPHLVDLSLSRCNAYCVRDESFYPPGLRDPIPLFGGVSVCTLRRLALVGVHVDWSPMYHHGATQAQGFPNLEELELKYHAREVTPSYVEFAAMLACSPKLARLSILGWGFQPPADGDGDSSGSDGSTKQCIELACLTHLTVGVVDVEHTLKTLTSLYCPSLEQFQLEDIEGSLFPYDHLDSTPILQYIANRYIMQCDAADDRSSTTTTSHTRFCCNTTYLPLSKLKSMTLCGIQATPASFVSLLTECLGLERLELRDVERGTVLKVCGEMRVQLGGISEFLVCGGGGGGSTEEESLPVSPAAYRCG